MFRQKQKDSAKEKEEEYTQEELARTRRLIDAITYDIEAKEKELEQLEKTLYDFGIREKNLKEDLERLRAEKKRLTQALERMEVR